MDDRTLATAFVGALLLRSSAQLAERGMERSMAGNWQRELHRIGHTWRRRASDAGALGGGLLGIVVVVLAYRSAQRTAQVAVAQRDDQRGDRPGRSATWT